MVTLDELKAEVIAAGFHVSAGSFEDGVMIYAASVETVPGTMGHPRYEVSYRKESGIKSGTDGHYIVVR